MIMLCRFLAILLVVLSAQLSATEVSKFFGGADLKNGELESIQVYGQSSIEDYKFNLGTFYGQLSLKNSTTGNIHFNGSGDISESSIEKLSFNGVVKIKDSRIDSINATSSNIILNNTKVSGDIIIDSGRSISGIENTSILEIRGDSLIKGKVVFKSGNGVINVHGNTSVPLSIIGANVVRKV